MHLADESLMLKERPRTANILRAGRLAKRRPQTHQYREPLDMRMKHR
jgi:hypothetical protein